MLTQEQLAVLREKAQAATIEQLERELDWLADKLEHHCITTHFVDCGISQCPKIVDGIECVRVEAEEWRELARRATRGK